MSENEEETEIKIEYFETDEIDPLGEECASKYTSTTKYFDENINQPAASSFSEGLKNDDSPVNDENKYPDVSENKESLSWYKSIDNAGRYLCKFCEHSYSSIQSICCHVKLKHVDEYNRIKSTSINKIRRMRLKCHICKNKFKNTTNLQEHLEAHGITNIKKSCTVCHASFEKDTEIHAHVTNRQKKKHFCTKCGYSTSKTSHFKQHENTHLRRDVKKCSYCEYTTYHSNNLKIHEHIHSNNKPFVCSVNGCDYRCAALSGLYSHRLKHEKKNMLYCDQCSYSTVYRQSLQKHLDSHRRNSVRTKF